jgi:hypothetical protein
MRVIVVFEGRRRNMKGKYDDEAALKGRRLIPGKYWAPITAPPTQGGVHTGFRSEHHDTARS